MMDESGAPSAGISGHFTGNQSPVIQINVLSHWVALISITTSRHVARFIYISDLRPDFLRTMQPTTHRWKRSRFPERPAERDRDLRIGRSWTVWNNNHWSFKYTDFFCVFRMWRLGSTNLEPSDPVSRMEPHLPAPVPARAVRQIAPTRVRDSASMEPAQAVRAVHSSTRKRPSFCFTKLPWWDANSLEFRQVAHPSFTAEEKACLDNQAIILW